MRSGIALSEAVQYGVIGKDDRVGHARPCTATDGI